MVISRELDMRHIAKFSEIMRITCELCPRSVVYKEDVNREERRNGDGMILSIHYVKAKLPAAYHHTDT